MLDLQSVRMFVLAVEFGSLTRAAEAAGTVQPVVSQRLKALERTVGRRLLDRTPRFVRATADGVAFLDRARTLLASHDDALRFSDAPTVRLAVGFSDHAIGLGASAVLRRLRAALPAGATLEARTGMSQDVEALFDAGELDAAIVRRETAGGDGETLGADPLGWRAAPGWVPPAGAPVPLAVLASPCGVRAAAIRALDASRTPWREAFTAGSCAALLAGVEAGLGVAPMGRAASGDAPDQGPALGLPDLPPSRIVMLARAGSPTAAAAVNALSAAVVAGLSRPA
ncbi:LysR family transcriptional regulator [Hansschlegelia quercus]|uniref:LysR family transcriptional regulator n=1 Tax=Hansschlegelia quercus TaxID=2528245 RepID=A0A4Q9GD08_9HYPH|nr:LysR family transcriptional regulator [Hansschlegelia quercus]TBN47951.1 LysR family transcriptional regulator [Hansschlegelia quercus]